MPTPPFPPPFVSSGFDGGSRTLPTKKEKQTSPAPTGPAHSSSLAPPTGFYCGGAASGPQKDVFSVSLTGVLSAEAELEVEVFITECWCPQPPPPLPLTVLRSGGGGGKEKKGRSNEAPDITAMLSCVLRGAPGAWPGAPGSSHRRHGNEFVLPR